MGSILANFCENATYGKELRMKAGEYSKKTARALSF